MPNLERKLRGKHLESFNARLEVIRTGTRAVVSLPSDEHLGFKYPDADGPFLFSQTSVANGVLLRHFTGEAGMPMDLVLQANPDEVHISYCAKGTILLNDNGVHTMVCPGLISCRRGAENAQGRIGRGLHEWHTLVFDKSLLEGPIHSAESKGLFSEQHKVGLTSVLRLQTGFCLATSGAVIDQFLGLGRSLFSLATMVLESDTLPFEHILVDPVSASGTPFEKIVAEVVLDPAYDWSLEEASTRVGYSTFYFSRSFKSSFGRGFPEIVDRARAQAALKVLIESRKSIEDIAKEVGFGSTAMLRKAMKTYFGLLPTEIPRGETIATET